MLKYPCLVLDHDDTVVQSETTINFPFFCYILDQYRPGMTITLNEYVDGCSNLGFAQMCRQLYNFTEQELIDEYSAWKSYVMTHTPDPYFGIKDVICRHKTAGGILCVASHSSSDNIIRDYQTHFGILPDAIYGWDLPEEKRKPSIYALQNIMERYHLSPSDILVVDDMRPGYIMASNAGVDIAFAAWGRKSFSKIYNEMTKLCNYTFLTPKELENFLFD